MDEKRRYLLSRRRFLQVGAVASSVALAACVAPTAPPAEDMAAGEAVDSEAAARWLTGMGDRDATGDFKIMSWEDEGEIRKFLLHINEFFDAFYPGLEPEVEWGIPWGEYWTKLPTLMAAGTPPDMAWQHQSRGQVFPSKGWSVDLTDYLNAYPPDGWPDDWWEASVKTMSWNGTVYAIPYDWATIGIYANRGLLDDVVGGYPADPDWTWNDFVETAIAVTGEDDNGMPVWGANIGPGASTVWNIAQAFGGWYFNDDMSQASFTNDGVVTAANLLWDLRWKHRAMPTPEDTQSMGLTSEFAFASGRVAMHRALNDTAFRMEEAISGTDNPFPWGVYAWPRGPEGRVAFAGNSGWFVPTGSRYPDTAYELIRYGLSNPDLLPTTGVMGSMIVSRKSFWEWGLPQGETAELIPNFQNVFVDIPAENQSTFPYWPGYQEWDAIWLKHMDPIFTEGQEGLEEALQALEDETNEFLAAEMEAGS